jgi:large subunit ribosomal protein L22
MAVTEIQHVSSARARFLRGSPTKYRLVADTIRGRGVTEALGIMQGLKKRASGPLTALLNSAIANAENAHPEIDVDELYVAEIFVDGGPSMPKRVRPAPMGRAYPIIKRTSHITVKLASREA